MPTAKQIEAGAKAFCAAWGYSWDNVAGTNACRCGEYACDCVAPDGEEGTYERPSRKQYREVAAIILKAAETT
jgi:hypothetical protein